MKLLQRRGASYVPKSSITAVAILGLIASILILSPPQAYAQALTVLANFGINGNLGSNAQSGLVMDRGGRLYGTNSNGGTYGWGTVYRLSPGQFGWSATTLYSFRRESDGGGPTGANLTIGPDGSLYGTTAWSSNGAGTVFNLRPPATICKTSSCPWIETTLHNFTGGSDGGFVDDNSYADALIFDGAGNIYGTTSGGGTFGAGVVFKVTHSSGTWSETVLWNFTDGSDGGFPYSGLISDGAGNLYGVTCLGGSEGNGVVYELSPSGSEWTQTVIYSFTGELSCPAGLTMDAQGNLYGTIAQSSGSGAAYELTLSNGAWNISKLQIFPCTGICGGPGAAPTLDTNGNLYGTNPAWGVYGEVFKLSPSGNGWNYTDLYEFARSQAYPIGAVLFDANGNLYGTSTQGGQNNAGIAWEITP